MVLQIEYSAQMIVRLHTYIWHALYVVEHEFDKEIQQLQSAKTPVPQVDTSCPILTLIAC